ncbi:MAG: hypothetical protein IH946_11330 [Bacteroidetes bacterium]|nr:hypothetical protein [Bacteroidota bacterium]
MPIIWAAAGVTGYYIGVNIDRTTAYRKAYEIKTNEDLTDDDQIKDILNFDEFGILYTSAELLILRNIYRNYLDISIIAFTLVYILNLVDATVDGHFYAYDISDDLSLDIRPSLDLTRGGLTPGITLALRL